MMELLYNSRCRGSQRNSLSRLRGRVGALASARDLYAVRVNSPTRRTLARKRAGECVDLPRKRER